MAWAALMRRNLSVGDSLAKSEFIDLMNHLLNRAGESAWFFAIGHLATTLTSRCYNCDIARI
jgi:hypothetical protein